VRAQCLPLGGDTLVKRYQDTGLGIASSIIGHQHQPLGLRRARTRPHCSAIVAVEKVACGVQAPAGIESLREGETETAQIRDIDPAKTQVHILPLADQGRRDLDRLSFGRGLNLQRMVTVDPDRIGVQPALDARDCGEDFDLDLRGAALREVKERLHHAALPVRVA